MPNPSTKHHYIPVFHIDKWIHPIAKRFWICKKNENGGVSDYFKLSGKSVGYVDDLYTLQSELLNIPQNIPDAIEERLQRIDSDASQVMKKLNEGKLDTLTESDREKWSIYIISLILRNPETISDFERIGIETAEIIQSQFSQSVNLNVINFLGAAANQAKAASITLSHKTEWANWISSNKWVIIPSKPECHYILTEFPVWIMKHNAEITSLAVPISPKKLWAIIPSELTKEEKTNLCQLLRTGYNATKVLTVRKFIISDEKLNDNGNIKYSKVRELLKHGSDYAISSNSIINK